MGRDCSRRGYLGKRSLYNHLSGDQMKLTMGQDRNGLKIVTVCGGLAGRGFSIQTNQNLPETHMTGVPDEREIINWVEIYGTPRQRTIIAKLQMRI